LVEYAKAAPEDILVRITVVNRGPDAAHPHLLPTLEFRMAGSFDVLSVGACAVPSIIARVRTVATTLLVTCVLH